MFAFEDLSQFEQEPSSTPELDLMIQPEEGEEPGYAEAIGKGIFRGTEGLAGGIGSTIRWAGDILGSKPIAELGTEASQYWRKAQQEGIAKPHPELFQGSFLDKPSLKRAFAIVAEAVPSLGAAITVSAATGQPWIGAGMLGLLEGAPQYEEAREEGKSIEEASAYGVMSTAGTAMLEYLPISRMLKRGKAVAKGTVKRLPSVRAGAVGAMEESAQEASQQIWQNFIAKVGYDPARNLAEGIVESMIGGFGAGGIAGGTIAKLNSVAEKADENGVTDDELDELKSDIERQVLTATGQGAEQERLSTFSDLLQKGMPVEQLRGRADANEIESLIALHPEL
ncbi:MAG: hypothetical protein JRH09_16095, partial [Deltaproteobacteria bacterium]|nr:hypothetical protein [Deltaproteobacteria bacterium]